MRTTGEAWDTARQTTRWAGDQIRAERRARFWSMQDVAWRVSVPIDVPTLSRIECGQHVPSEALADALETLLQSPSRPQIGPCTPSHQTNPIRLAPVARASDPETSSEAAASVDEFKARKTHRCILTMLQVCDGETDEALRERYNRVRSANDWPLQSDSGLRTRRAELVAAGLVEDSGRRERMRSGRRAIVWCLTEAGRQS